MSEHFLCAVKKYYLYRQTFFNDGETATTAKKYTFFVSNTVMQFSLLYTASITFSFIDFFLSFHFIHKKNKIMNENVILPA